MAVDRLGRPLRDDPYRGNVRVYSASNITLSGLQTIDGVTLESGDRVLCNGQTTTSQNGIYVASNGVWSRSRDLSTSDDFTGPIIVTVEEGTTYRNTFWHMLPSTTITVGTDAISFTTGYPAAQFGNGSALSVFGRASNSSGTRADIAAANDGEVLRRSGTTVGFGTVAAAGLATDAVETAKIANSAVTNAKQANMAAGTVKANLTGSSAAPSDTTDSAFVDYFAPLLNLNRGLFIPGGSYGSVGTADDAATLQATLNAANAYAATSPGGAVVKLVREHTLLSGLALVPNPGLRIVADHPGAELIFGGSSSFNGLYLDGGGATGSAFTISSASYGAEALTLSAVTGLAIGDYCEIEAETGYSTNVLRCRNRIRNIVGNVVTLDLPMPFAINGALTTSFRKAVMATGFACEGLRARLTGSGTVNGLCFFNLRDARIEGTRTDDFSTTNSQGFITYQLYGGVIDDVSDRGSGNTPGSNGMVISATLAQILNVYSDNPAGFGPGLTHVNSCQIVNLTSIRAAGRGIKLSGCCDSDFTNVRCDGSGASLTGLAVSGASSHNRFQNVITRRNNIGVSLPGDGNINNYFDGVLSTGNTTYDVEVITQSPLDDTGNEFHNLRGASTFNISATTLPVIRFASSGATADVASATTADLFAARSDNIRITGTTTITGLGTAPVGITARVTFAGALTLTHNATSLILPNNGANITTAAGDTALAVSLGSGNWRISDYQPAAGYARKVATTTAGQLARFTDTAGGMGASQMTEDGSGNVSVANHMALGTTTFNSLGLGRTFTIDTAGTGSYSGVEWKSGGTLQGIAIANSGSFILGSYANIPLVLRQANNDRVTISSTHVTSTLPVVVPSYTVAGVPSAATAAGVIYVSNEAGGAVLAFSDGTNWRRVTDRAIVS